MSKIDPHDPRLTAFALGEMPEPERTAFARTVQSDPAALAAVEEIRQTAATLSAALDFEPAPARCIEPPLAAAGLRPPRAPIATLLPFSYLIGGLAAACLAVAMLWRSELAETEAQLVAQQREVARLQALAADATAQAAQERERAAAAELAATAAATLAAATPSAPVPALEFPPLIEPTLQLPPQIRANLPTEVAMTPPTTGIRGPLGEPRAVVSFSRPEEIVLRPDPRPLAALETPKPRTVAPAPAAPAAPSAAPGATPRALPATDGATAAAPAPFLSPDEHPFSTFTATASDAAFGELRRAIDAGQRPSAAAIAVEEWLNHFEFEYAPFAGEVPLAIRSELYPAPWTPSHRLLRVGLPVRTAIRDVRVQVEFNPARVAAYRLLGYEHRPLPAAAFADGPVNSGEIPAGRTVTALFEIVPVGVKIDLPRAEEPKYQPTTSAPGKLSDEWLTVKVRWADSARIVLVQPMTSAAATAFDKPGEDFNFCAALAAFALVLQDSPHKGTADWALVERLARAGRGADRGGKRAEFIELVRRARDLSPQK